MSFASGKSGKLTRKLNPSDTSLYLNTDLGITAGRLYAINDTQVEFLNFTGKTNISATEWQYTGLTRQLSQTAVPAVSTGTGFTWGANQVFINDMMHDQILDPSLAIQVTSYANATARDVALPVPVNGMEVYLIAEGYFTDYVAGAWTTRASGAVANASDTVAGKVEMATLAETTAGTNTGGTGAPLVPTPGDVKTLYAPIGHTHPAYAVVKNGTLTVISQAVPAGSGGATSVSTGVIASPTIATVSLYALNGSSYLEQNNGSWTTLYANTASDGSTITFTFMLKEGLQYRCRCGPTAGGSAGASASLTYTV